MSVSRRVVRAHASTGGFSLIELMVSMALFAIVMMVAISTLLVLIDVNRRTQAIKTSMNNTFFSMESITRLIRTGHSYRCAADNTATTMDCQAGSSSLWFTDDTGRRVQVYWEPSTRRVWHRIGGGVPVPITAGDMEIDSFRFFVTGAAAGTTNQQPTVTLALVGVAARGTRLETTVELQTTVTQRMLDIQ